MKTLFSLTFLCLVLVGNAFGQAFWERENSFGYPQKFAATDNGYIYSVRNNVNVEMSMANGAQSSWTQLTGYPSNATNEISAFGNDVLLCNHNFNYNGRGVYVTTDDGTSWQQRNNGLGADTNVVFVYPLANGVGLAVIWPNNSIYKLYRSTDLGLNWSFVQSYTGYPSGATAVSQTEAYFSTGSTMYKSTDNGATWVDLSSSNTYPIGFFAILQNGDMVARGSDTLIRSTDHGVNWTPIQTVGLPAMSNGGNALYKAPGDTLYTTVNAMNGIHYSADGGTTWATTGTGITYPTQLFQNQIVMSKGGYLFASPSSDIWRSINRVSGNLVGIEAHSLVDNSVQVYPNPSRGTVAIEGGERSKASSASKLEVLDLAGRKVACDISYSTGKWMVSGLPSGLYCYRIVSAGGSLLHTGKLVVENL
ncbi:MAG: T9SS type A sorting domain-containing protein [Bacteroidetes bacterium]|nr:T9SS type A sorting domain-containing protein [Bacteroidota bacterium]MBP6720690.1 T9SS type A sorting domain-containing protein [Bacteroidia bacterium]MBP8073142.1 T9SS type A sorting domain-containing protein [Bacteroidia bacterium]